MTSLLVFGLWATVALGHTWTVMKDGSGDFTVIQTPLTRPPTAT